MASVPPCILILKHESLSSMMRVVYGMNFKSLVNFVCAKWNFLDSKNLHFLAYLPGHSESMVDNDEDLNNLLSLARNFSMGHVDVLVKRGCLQALASNVDVYGGIESSSSLVDISPAYNDEFEQESNSILAFENNKRKTLLTSGWSADICHVGQCFSGGVTEFRNVLLKFRVEVGFEYVLIKNDKSRVTAECKYKISKGCQWRVHASIEKSNDFFFIRSFNNMHTCCSVIRTSKYSRLGSDIVAGIIADRISIVPLVRPTDVSKEIKSDYGLDVSYFTAWYGVEKAKRMKYGEHSSSFDLLRVYFEEANACNPGSHFEIECDVVSGCFKRCFVSFGASISGFNFCRPLLFLDETFLKGCYKGNLLAATAKDGEEGIFVVAFAIVLAEDEDNWLWFLRLLKPHIDCTRNLTFMSDHHSSILNGVRNVFPSAHHSFCLLHMKGNLKDRLKGYSSSFREMIVKKFEKCAFVASRIAFNDCMQELLSVGGANVASFIEDALATHWANAYFTGNRYGEMYSNLAESFNSLISEYRSLPITNLVDKIRWKFMDRISSRRDNAKTWNLVLCPSKEKKIQTFLKEDCHWVVSASSVEVFEVHSSPVEVVNILQRVCSCGRWQINGFPCSHAFAVLSKSGKVIYDYVENYFHVAFYVGCYSQSIFPVQMVWKVGGKNADALIFPPKSKKQPGWPKKKRIRSVGESIPRKIKCGRCGQIGNHNKRSCNGAL